MLKKLFLTFFFIIVAVVVFLSFNNNKKNGDIGYALLKNNKVVTTAYGDSEQHQDLNKGYLILYGEKPSEDITILKVKISLRNNYPDVDKTFDLTDKKYYLVSYKLPEKDLFAHVEDEYIFE